MMTRNRTPVRLAAALLLTAAAFPSTALLAQDTQPVPDPVVDTAPPPPLPAETPAPAPEPVQAPAPTVTAPAPTVATTPSEPAPTATQRQTARSAARTAPRTPARAAPAPAAAAAPAPAAAAPAPAPAAEVPAPAAEALPPPAALPAAPAAEAPAAPAEQGARSILPWAIAGLLALGVIAFFLLRRRRAVRSDERVYETDRAEILDAPAPAAVAPAAVAPAAVAAVDEGRPEIDLDLRPRRAGVTGDEAVVEFELALDNHGSAPARDVRVSTWLVASGQAGEMESALIDRGDEASLPAIAAGSAEHMAGAVTLPTRGLPGDAVLPVVVAEARYTLPDGSEGRTHATYAVGVPDGEELAHFAIDNPSGLHDDVVAKELGEAERV